MFSMRTIVILLCCLYFGDKRASVGYMDRLNDDVNVRDSHQNIPRQEISDTLKLAGNDYKLLLEDEYNIKIEIINSRILQILKDKQDPVISFSLAWEKFIAKGNYIINSSVPYNCNLFYSTNKEGCLIMFEENIVMFHRIGKGKVSG